MDAASVTYTDFCSRPTEGMAVMPLQSAPPDGGVSPVLVGRDTEVTALAAAVSSPPALIVIEGEAGIGKSRLVRELLTAAPVTSAVLTGHCQQLHDPFPLGPVLDAFQHHGELIRPGGL